MVGKLLAAIPDQRLIELAGQFARLLDERRDDAAGILVGDLDQDHVARLAFDQRRDVAAQRPGNEVAFPMPGHGTIFDRLRPLAERYRVLPLAQTVPFHAGVPRARSEERRVGNMWCSPCRYRWSSYP